MASHDDRLVPSQHKALRELLLDMFDPAELRVFVADLYPGVEHAVAWQQAPVQLAFNVVRALHKRGLLTRGLRNALIAAAPNRSTDIERVWDVGGTANAASSAIGGSSNASAATTPAATGSAAAAAQPTAGAAFDVFLSHNSKDKPLVREVGLQLRGRQLRVWLDEWELTPGRAWQEALEEVIETCKAAAIFVGPAEIGPWQSPEMRACLQQFVQRKLPVIPVLLPGAPARVQLPLFLSAMTWVDMRSGVDDPHTLDRLVWGITGVKPSSLP